MVGDNTIKACLYLPRYRRAAHVTPKSFLSFISMYKKIYNEKKNEIGESAARMTSGLDKLQEASLAVERLREELFVMEENLAVASDKAQKVGGILNTSCVHLLNVPVRV